MKTIGVSPGLLDMKILELGFNAKMFRDIVGKIKIALRKKLKIRSSILPNVKKKKNTEYKM